MTGDIVPRTRHWRATTTAVEGERSHILLVSGEIELGNRNERPRLSLSEPQGADPMILNLDVEIIVEGLSGLAMHWAQVEFRHRLPQAPPQHVRLFWMGVEIASLAVPD
jgi:hypothetical protein